MGHLVSCQLLFCKSLRLLASASSPMRTLKRIAPLIPVGGEVSKKGPGWSPACLSVDAWYGFPCLFEPGRSGVVR